MFAIGKWSPMRIKPPFILEQYEDMALKDISWYFYALKGRYYDARGKFSLRLRKFTWWE
jgi:hypothetical protein